MTKGSIGRSSAQKKHMIEVLDNWNSYNLANQNLVKTLFGWDTENNFNPIQKREDVYESLMHRKNREDYTI